MHSEIPSNDRSETTDQAAFDAQVDRTARRLAPIAAAAGIFAALLMSVIAITIATNRQTTTVQIAPPATAATATVGAPMRASVVIDHVTRGCHALAVNGGLPDSPDATLRLAPGGTLHLQNNDVMPHRLLVSKGPASHIRQALMGHMGATSSVTFATPGTYQLTTKAGEDYMKGVMTLGPDNVIKIKVIVA